MQSNQPRTERNTLSPVADAAVALLLRILRDPDLVAAARALVATAPPPLKSVDLTPKELAAALGASSATVARCKITPSHYVGQSPRYDLESARAQLAARGRKATAPPKKNVDNIDVSDVAARGGLRIAK